MHRTTVLGFAASALLTASVLGACSETQQVPDDAGGDATSPTLDGSLGADAAKDAPPPFDAAGWDAAAIRGVAFNELSATGGDWVELYNTTSSPVDLGGTKLADNEADASAPRVARALQFAPGTTIAPGGYLVVLANEKDASATPVPCFDGGACPAVDWGISKDNANTIYLLGPDDKELLKVEMPANAHVSGESWGRFPDGTGSFGVRKTPTPGAANVQ
jgi:hypothetical protein